ncbi:hypothetical protein NK6_7857 [Bradyrhizobium diazoefficiens]|uniref:Uncharacterized protein n=1 Tax=Bradyrhizobium diazoefficiens TaxID=1355477 RepID=A0A0E4BU80_9BRAD|nr:hypothetical protein NK6_7857 [Bradyrhizobium diazoefficiens]
MAREGTWGLIMLCESWASSVAGQQRASAGRDGETGQQKIQWFRRRLDRALRGIARPSCRTSRSRERDANCLICRQALTGSVQGMAAPRRNRGTHSARRD